MGKGHLRNDNECEECGYPDVTMAYCPKCGQHNVETRQSFGHLITHFAEDFTHYDSGFWKTIKYLLLCPARLTKEYLIGRRQRYVPPVKLYIFISFLAFLLPAMLPLNLTINGKNGETLVYAKNKPIIISEEYKVNSYKQLDSLYNLPDNNISWFAYKQTKNKLEMRDRGVNRNQVTAYISKLLPKVFFFYLPVFAFWLWLFHSKKRWCFFDHGIFTLHYFSFLLLFFTCLHLIVWAIEPLNIAPLRLYFPAFILFFSYSFFYFFRAHRRMYGETKMISRSKSLVLFIVNVTCLIIAFLLATLYTQLTYH